MEPDIRPELDAEGRRLLAALEACHAKELAAAGQLSNPRRSMLYPTYAKLVDALGVLRLKCRGTTLALRAHRKKMRD